MTKRLMIVEDDDTVRTLLQMLLEDEQFEVVAVADPRRAIGEFSAREFDLVLLDLRMPEISGFDVCREIRRGSSVPIIMVTAQQDSHDVVAALELGADDYVTKPFNDRELLARIRVQLRRRPSSVDDERIVLGSIEILPESGIARRDGAEIALTRTEFHLLCHLARSPNRVWSREQLLHEVWGYDYAGDARLVDTHVARLRSKIEVDSTNPQFVQTVRGLGYRLVRGDR